MTGFESVLNVHPLWVHFPIAITILVLIFEVLGRISKWKFPSGMAAALIYSAAISAVITVLTGFMAANSIGHDSPGHDLVHEHREIMVTYTLIIVALALANLFIGKRGGAKVTNVWLTWLRPSVLVVAVVVLTIGADLGGELVFRQGLGMRPATTIQSGDAPASLPPGRADSTEARPLSDDGHDHVH